ncbi:GATA zinc finger family protein [Iris pallida]|uniref:GATA zinc finger family protein n=1 Tax=Iris pallida TaxID=29817 RepID=A0AAX6DTF6_IRIPA|nr:GATA zinc finger family protein [Iris pallida]
MDIHSTSVPSSLPEDLFPGENNMEEGGGGGASLSLEWLSAFVEECLNGGGGFASQPVPSIPPPTTTNSSSTKPIAPRPTTKSRTKRRKLDPESPLVMVPRSYCRLAESELVVLLPTRKEGGEVEVEVEEECSGGRRCTHCMSQKTPQWRAGPLGPKTLCNACGVRFKSGRLLPEYRPAKSPTFQTYKHSNSHKKVLEMRSSSSSNANSDRV